MPFHRCASGGPYEFSKTHLSWMPSGGKSLIPGLKMGVSEDMFA